MSKPWPSPSTSWRAVVWDQSGTLLPVTDFDQTHARQDWIDEGFQYAKAVYIHTNRITFLKAYDGRVILFIHRSLLDE